MRTVYEFRVNGDYADRLFRPDEGKDLGSGSVRLIHISPDDPRFVRIGELDRVIHRDHQTFFFAGWHIHRRYTAAEIAAAPMLKVRVKPCFEPPGELCGTLYDESTACPHCGAGATQASDLRLDLRKAPKTKDIARTIAGEIIVSQRMAERMIDTGLRGFELRRVRHKARYEDDSIDLREVPSGRELLQQAKAAGAPHGSGDFYVWINRAENTALWDKAREEFAAMRRQTARVRGKPAPIWYQLIVTATVDVAVPPTRTGDDPFDDDPHNEHRCPLGHVIGLNLLSELWIKSPGLVDADVGVTRQYFGRRAGLLRPEPRLVISQRFWRVIQESKLKGLEVEVVHLV